MHLQYDNCIIWHLKLTFGPISHDHSPVPSTSLGLDARKPIFGGLRTTKAQTSLHFRQTDQRLCYSILGSIISKLAIGEVSIL